MYSLGMHFNRSSSANNTDMETVNLTDDSGSDTDSDTDNNSDADTIVAPLFRNPIDRIYLFEHQTNIFSEKIDGKYYIGIAAPDGCSGQILDIALSLPAFFRFPPKDVLAYARTYCTVSVTLPRYRRCIDILQVKIIHGVYSVVVKTTWLKAVQRKWRSILSARAVYTNRLVHSQD